MTINDKLGFGQHSSCVLRAIAFLVLVLALAPLFISPGAAGNTPSGSSPDITLASTKGADPDANLLSGLARLFSGDHRLPGRGSGIAVYDISGATVHMPDGTKLVAHSGIGHRMDDPKYAYERNRGPTPPNVYKLRMRESRFHGVEAIRMLPLDVAAMRGRAGILAHSRLLRNSIGSHGCVAFKDYDKFLNAFKRGEVTTMIVVPDMSELPKYMALYQTSKHAAI